MHHRGIGMKVLITTEFYLPATNGVVISVLNLRKALSQNGHEVRILTISNVASSYYIDNCYYIKADRRQLYPDSFVSLNTRDKLVDAAIAWHPDIIHSQCEAFTLLFAKRIAKACDIQIVHTCHTFFPDYGHYFSRFERLWMVLVKWYCRIALRKIKTIIAPSQKVIDMLTDDFHMKNEIKLVPTGLDLDEFSVQVEENEIKNFRQKLGIDENDTVLVTVGRLCKEKSISDLLNYFSSYCANGKKVKLVIVGEGPEHETISDKVQELGIQDSVIFTGFIEQIRMPLIYKASDALVSASHSETQGLTYYEALASGIPLICMFDPCLEQILQEGKNGYFYTDERSFATAIEQIADPAKKIFLNKQATTSVMRYGLSQFGTTIQSIYEAARTNNKGKLADNAKNTNTTRQPVSVNDA